MNYDPDEDYSDGDDSNQWAVLGVIVGIVLLLLLVRKVFG